MTIAKLTEAMVRDLPETCMNGSPLAEDCARYIAGGYDADEDVDEDFATSADRIVAEINRRARHERQNQDASETLADDADLAIRSRRNGAAAHGVAVRRGAVAHLRHPGGGGGALCGARRESVRVCPECLRIRTALALVHVASARAPGLAMCGLVLEVTSHRGEVLPTPGEVGWVPTPMYLSAERALELLARGGNPGLPVCSGCEINLRRQETRPGGRGRLIGRTK